MNHESPIINGDGSNSRDFTYIDNVVQMNLLSLSTENESALNQVFNTACGDRISLMDLSQMLKAYLGLYDPTIEDVEIKFGATRDGDISHSMASIKKVQKKLGFEPTHKFKSGLKEAVNWYWFNLK